MTAKFWLFNKKENSTARPSANTGTDLDIKLKERVDVDNPVILCATNVMNYNYMQFEGSYYFIRRKTYVANSLFEIEAERDPLATLKSSITASSQFVTRSNVVYDDNLIDNMYPRLIEPSYSSEFKVMPFDFSTNMMLVLTVKGAEGSLFYGLRLGNFAGGYGSIADTLFSKTQDDLWQDLGSLPGSAFKEFSMTYLDPFGYITDARLIPIDQINASGTSTATVTLGHWDYTDPDGAQVFKKLDRIVYKTATPVSIPIRAGFTDHKKFLNTNDYRTVRVYLPGCGHVFIDANKIKGATSVDVSYEIDVTGAIFYKVYCGTDVQFVSGNISTPYAVYSSIANVGAIIGAVGGVVTGGVVGAIGGAVKGGFFGGLGGAIGGVVSGGLNTIGSASPLYTSGQRGTDGSLCTLSSMPNIFVEEWYYDIPTQAPDIYGYPCMKQATLNVNGYYQIDNPVVTFGDDLTIKNAVIDHMRRGFYVE